MVELKKNSNTKKANIIAAVCVILLALAGVVSWFILSNMGPQNKVAVIYQYNKEVQRIDLSKVNESYELTFTSRDGGKNVVHIEKKGVSIIEASCPDHVCMDTGVIKNGVLPIICAPNHLMIKIEEKSAEGLDSISY